MFFDGKVRSAPMASSRKSTSSSSSSSLSQAGLLGAGRSHTQSLVESATALREARQKEKLRVNAAKKIQTMVRKFLFARRYLRELRSEFDARLQFLVDRSISEGGGGSKHTTFSLHSSATIIETIIVCSRQLLYFYDTNRNNCSIKSSSHEVSEKDGSRLVPLIGLWKQSLRSEDIGYNILHVLLSASKGGQLAYFLLGLSECLCSDVAFASELEDFFSLMIESVGSLDKILPTSTLKDKDVGDFRANFMLELVPCVCRLILNLNTSNSTSNNVMTESESVQLFNTFLLNTLISAYSEQNSKRFWGSFFSILCDEECTSYANDPKVLFQKVSSRLSSTTTASSSHATILSGLMLGFNNIQKGISNNSSNSSSAYHFRSGRFESLYFKIRTASKRCRDLLSKTSSEGFQALSTSSIFSSLLTSSAVQTNRPATSSGGGGGAGGGGAYSSGETETRIGKSIVNLSKFNHILGYFLYSLDYFPQHISDSDVISLGQLSSFFAKLTDLSLNSTFVSSLAVLDNIEAVSEINCINHSNRSLFSRKNKRLNQIQKSSEDSARFAKFYADCIQTFLNTQTNILTGEASSDDLLLGQKTGCQLMDYQYYSIKSEICKIDASKSSLQEVHMHVKGGSLGASSAGNTVLKNKALENVIYTSIENIKFACSIVEILTDPRFLNFLTSLQNHLIFCQDHATTLHYFNSMNLWLRLMELYHIVSSSLPSHVAPSILGKSAQPAVLRFYCNPSHTTSLSSNSSSFTTTISAGGGIIPWDNKSINLYWLDSLSFHANNCLSGSILSCMKSLLIRMGSKFESLQFPINNSGFESDLSLINFINIPNIESHIKSHTADNLNRAMSSALSCFSIIYLHQLIAIDDEEFCSTSMHQNFEVMDTLIPNIVGWLFQSFWLRNTQIDAIMRLNEGRIASFCSSARSDFSSFFWQTFSQFGLSMSMSSLYNHLHSRNERIKFVEDPSILEWNPSLPNFRLREAELEPLDDFRFEFETHTFKFVLLTIPYVIPFSKRLLIFNKLVQKYKERNTTWGEEFGGMGETVDIRRDHLFEDAYNRLHNIGDRLKKRVRIQFISQGGSVEAGVDGGGLFKEFIDSFMLASFDPANSLFSNNSENLLYVTPGSVESLGRECLDHYRFLGKMLGKALYEGILVEPHFSIVFLNRLLGKVNQIDDFKFYDPTYYKSLVDIKKKIGEGSYDAADLCLSFTSTRMVRGGGAAVETELCKGGADMFVTNENFLRYFHHFANFRTNYETKQQMEYFLDGFRHMIPLRWIRMFDTMELQKLISGVVDIDIEDLKSNVVYQGGYFADDPYIIAFWEIIYMMEPSLKSDFVKFVTSVGRQPLNGFGRLEPKFGIQQVLEYVDHTGVPRLPTAATCFNLLKLPRYETVEMLREKLVKAIEYNSGFELS